MPIVEVTDMQFKSMKLRPAVKSDCVLNAMFLATDRKGRKVIARWGVPSYYIEGKIRLMVKRSPRKYSKLVVPLASSQLIINGSEFLGRS